MYFTIDTSGDVVETRGPFKPGYVGGPELIAKLKAVNTRITGPAPVLNSLQLGAIDATTWRDQSSVTVTSTGGIPIDTMVRKYNGQTYVFAQASGNDTNVTSGDTTGTFTLSGIGSGTLTVRDENRTLAYNNGVRTDRFTPYGLHIYVL
jgi:hypothetical protein